MNTRKQNSDFWDTNFGSTTVEVPVPAFTHALAIYLRATNLFATKFKGKIDDDSLRQTLRLIFNPQRFFIKRVESDFFFIRGLHQDDFWRLIARPQELERLCSKIKELKGPTLSSLDSKDEDWSATYSLIDERSSEEKSIISFCKFYEIDKQNGYFLGTFDSKNGRKSGRLRFVVHKTKLYIQDLSYKNSVRIQLNAQTRICATKGLVIGIGLQAKHKFRVIDVFPLPIEPESKSRWTVCLNAWDNSNKTMSAMVDRDISDLFQMNAYHFANQKSDFKSEKPKVIIEFLTGEYKGKVMEFDAPLGSFSAKNPAIEYSFGMSESADISFKDTDMHGRCLKLSFDASAGWMFQAFMVGKLEGPCCAYAFLKGYNEGTELFEKSSLFQPVLSNMHLIIDESPILLKKTLMYNGAVIE
jgi:hypothetical protein